MTESENTGRFAAEFNPYQAPDAHQPVADVPMDRRQSLGWLRLWSGLLLLTLTIGTPLAVFYSIESIVATGPFALVFGLIVVSRGIKCRRIVTTLTGVITAIFVLFVFALINLNEWSPREAEEPVGAMIVVFDVLVVPLLLYGIFAGDAKYSRDQIEVE